MDGLSKQIFQVGWPLALHGVLNPWTSDKKQSIETTLHWNEIISNILSNFPQNIYVGRLCVGSTNWSEVLCE